MRKEIREIAITCTPTLLGILIFAYSLPDREPLCGITGLVIMGTSLGWIVDRIDKSILDQK